MPLVVAWRPKPNLAPEPLAETLWHNGELLEGWNPGLFPLGGFPSLGGGGENATETNISNKVIHILLRFSSWTNPGMKPQKGPGV